MNRHRQILLLRVSFWICTVLDGLVAIQLLIPDLWASFNGSTTYMPSAALNFGLVIASSLMWGWTALLFWADRKPMERKGTLLLTTFPVIFGLAANNVYAVASGLIALESILPTLAIQCGLTTPPPSLSVSVVGSSYNDDWGQFTVFTCNVTINDHAWDSLVAKFVAANNITVTDAISFTQVTGDIATTLPAVLPQLNMNYGLSNSMTISSVVNGHFTITLHSEKQSLLSGVNMDTLAGALTDKLNQLLATQT